MEEFNNNTYYALLWNTSLDLGREIKVEGTIIHRDTKLPDDPRILYGANNNDVAKIRKPKTWKKIEYDVRTTQQRVVYWKDVEEYALPRDVRVVIWSGHDTLWLPYDNYKIVTPECFEAIASVQSGYEKDCSLELVSKSSDESYAEPSSNLKEDVLDMIINSNMSVNEISKCIKSDRNIIKSEKRVDDNNVFEEYGWALS